MTFFSKFKAAHLSETALAAALLVAPGIASAQSDPFIGQVALVGFNFCPNGWAEANGALLPINQNTALFSLYGTFYGGDGISTFALPDLRGRFPMGQGNGPGLTSRSQGERSGQESQALNILQMPSHNHSVNATAKDGNQRFPGGKLLGGVGQAGSGTETIYSNAPATTTMSPTMLGNVGGGQPFSTMNPYLVMRYCVALVGIFPSRP